MCSVGKALAAHFMNGVGNDKSMGINCGNRIENSAVFAGVDAAHQNGTGFIGPGALSFKNGDAAFELVQQALLDLGPFVRNDHDVLRAFTTECGYPVDRKRRRHDRNQTDEDGVETENPQSAKDRDGIDEHDALVCRHGQVFVHDQSRNIHTAGARVDTENQTESAADKKSGVERGKNRVDVRERRCVKKAQNRDKERIDKGRKQGTEGEFLAQADGADHEKRNVDDRDQHDAAERNEGA